MEEAAGHITERISSVMAQRQHASDIAHQTEIATLRNEIQQLRVASEVAASQSHAAGEQSVMQVQEQYLQLQDDLAVERAKRQHAEKLWMEQMGATQGTARQADTRTALLESQLQNRDEQVNRLGEQLSSMGDAITQLKAQIEAWEDSAVVDGSTMQSSPFIEATASYGVPPIPSMTTVGMRPALPIYAGLGLGDRSTEAQPSTPVMSTARTTAFGQGTATSAVPSANFSFPTVPAGGQSVVPPRAPAASPSLALHPGMLTPFANVAWRPKEPPTFSGKQTEDVHTWSEVVTNYFRFMNGTSNQEVAYAATLLRDNAHIWWQPYLRHNGGCCPRDWSTMSAGLVERFGSRLRDKQALADIVAMRQNGRPVAEYSAQFENCVGKLQSSDQPTLVQFYIWGLDPALAEKVVVGKPQTISAAVALADDLELAVKFAHRPPARVNTGAGNAPRGHPNPYRARGRRGYWGRGYAFVPRGRGNRGQRGGQNGGRGGGLVCYGCGGRGHMRDQCPTYRQQQQQPRGGNGNARARGRGRGQAAFAAFGEWEDNEQ